MTNEKELRWISGFWSRIVAFVIDVVVLGVVGFFLGLFLEDFFIKLGGWGPLIGFAVASAYFGVMNSRISNGQTLGKKALKIKVVDVFNDHISLGRSMGRFCVIGIPWFASDFQEITYLPSLLSEALNTALCFMASSALYLYVFNRVTRQSLHDLVFGTYVVKTKAERRDVGTVWRPHLAVVALIFVASVLLPVLMSDMSKMEPFPNLIRVREILMENPLVRDVSVQDGKSISRSIGEGAKEATYVTAHVILKDNLVSNVELARGLADVIKENYPRSLEKDVLVIHLTYGFDIGIYSRYEIRSYQFKPSDLGESNPAA